MTDSSGQAERYVMNELYDLEQTAIEGYTCYNLPKGTGPTFLASFFMKIIFLVINALNNFANTTMSSLYFDITKDCLYADGKDSLERRSVATVLEQVKNLSFNLNIDLDH